MTDNTKRTNMKKLTLKQEIGELRKEMKDLVELVNSSRKDIPLGNLMTTIKNIVWNTNLLKKP